MLTPFPWLLGEYLLKGACEDNRFRPGRANETIVVQVAGFAKSTSRRQHSTLDPEQEWLIQGPSTYCLLPQGQRAARRREKRYVSLGKKRAPRRAPFLLNRDKRDFSPRDSSPQTPS